MISEKDIYNLALEIRISSLRLTSISSASHIGSCFSVADILAAILIKCEESRSQLFFSKGHAAAALYSGLSEMGKFDKKFLSTFGENGSELIGHVNHKVPGVVFSTGSLGHGLPVAAGYALGNPETFTYVILSDGELNEGTTWETLALSKHLQISNLKIIIDLNGIQSFGTTKQVLDLEPLGDKFKSFGWGVKEIDGHDHSELFGALFKEIFAPFEILLAKTVKGKGIKSMENKLLWHYKSWPQEALDEGVLELRNNA
jgi:transketolase